MAAQPEELGQYIAMTVLEVDSQSKQGRFQERDWNV